MATPKWQAGKLYPTGSIVQPVSGSPANPTALLNPGFESGDTGWDKTGGWVMENVGPGVAFTGDWDAACGTTSGELINQNAVPISPGTSLTVSCKVKAGGTVGNGAGACIVWYDASDVRISRSDGNGSAHTNDTWENSSVTAIAPAGTASTRACINGNIAGPGYCAADAVTWNYTSSSAPSGLVFKAVQPGTGTSGSNEPVWPNTVGVQVVDNTVIWEAVQDSQVVWEASAILVSGATEPTWPESVGGTVADGSIVWTAVSRRVEDENCPNTRAVTIADSKVYAADDDIIRFCATVNPLDWTTPDDAGYLPSGLNQNGSNSTEVLNLYRSSVVSFSSSTFQNWQVDPDPANMDLLDSIEGIGSIYQLAAQPVANDLFFLAALGVRSVGIAAGATNLSAGDAGMPIDPLIQAEMTAAALDGTIPRSLYHPSQGQYQIYFGPQAFVYSLNEIGQPGKWSRYVYPWEVEGDALLNDALYFRSGDSIYLSDINRLDDEDADGDPVPVDMTIRWPYLDFGAPGVTKMMLGFDLVGRGQCSVSIGFDQNNFAIKTTPYSVQADTLTGGIIPIPLAAPSFSLELTFSSDDNDTSEEWLASNFYLQDFRQTV